MSLRAKGTITFLVLFSLTILFYLMINRSKSFSQTGMWTKISENLEFDHFPAYTDLIFFDRDNGISLSLMSVKITKDGGRTWRDQLQFNNTVLSSLAVTKSDIWIVGEQLGKREQKSEPVLLKAGKKELLWTKVNFDTDSKEKAWRKIERLDDICFQNEEKFWAVGDSIIIESEIRQNTAIITNVFDLNEDIHHIFCGNTGKIWALGDNGIVAFYDKSRWETRNLGKDRLFTGISINGPDVWLTGRSISDSESTIVKGVLLRSRDDGLTWEDKSPASTDGITDIYFNQNIGWLVGLNGSIFRTDDGGETWRRVKSPTTNNLMSIFFLNSTNGWIGGEKGTILEFHGEPPR